MSDRMDEAEKMADEYRRLVRRRTGIKPSDLVCPREQSDMTPCIARDGHLAVAEATGGAVCVGCDWRVAGLLAGERDRATG